MRVQGSIQSPSKAHIGPCSSPLSGLQQQQRFRWCSHRMRSGAGCQHDRDTTLTQTPKDLWLPSLRLALLGRDQTFIAEMRGKVLYIIMPTAELAETTEDRLDYWQIFSLKEGYAEPSYLTYTTCKHHCGVNSHREGLGACCIVHTESQLALCSCEDSCLNCNDSTKEKCFPCGARSYIITNNSNCTVASEGIVKFIARRYSLKKKKEQSWR